MRPSSPINIASTQQPQQQQPPQQQQQQQQMLPSPLPNIQAGPVHFQGLASPRPGYSPGVDSTREYSESEDDDTPGGGMLKGEGLIP